MNLPIGLLCISLISSPSWTYTVLSGKRCLQIFEGDSGKEAKLGSWFRQFKRLSSREAFLLPSTPVLPTVQLTTCLGIRLVKKLGRAILFLVTASGSAFSHFSLGIVGAGPAQRWALLYQYPTSVGPLKALELRCHVDNLLTDD